MVALWWWPSWGLQISCGRPSGCGLLGRPCTGLSLSCGAFSLAGINSALLHSKTFLETYQWHGRVLSPSLIKCMNIIHRAFREHSGPTWLNYDEHFRLRRAHNLALDLRILQGKLCVQLVMPAKANGRIGLTVDM